MFFHQSMKNYYILESLLKFHLPTVNKFQSHFYRSIKLTFQKKIRKIRFSIFIQSNFSFSLEEKFDSQRTTRIMVVSIHVKKEIRRTDEKGTEPTKTG